MELQTVNAALNAKVDALGRANDDLRNLFDSTRMATVFLDRDLLIHNYTATACTVIDIVPGDCGRPFDDIVGLGRLAEDVRRVLADGAERSVAYDSTETHYLVRIAPQYDSAEEIEGVVLTFIDVTPLTRSDAQQKVLLHELQHRVKNVLATTGALALRLLRTGPSLETFSTAFLGRLRAMAVTHELLSRGRWNGARLHELIEITVGGQAMTDRAISMAGPDLTLAPDAATTLGTVFYELATNAAKYGALSDRRGRISVAWRISDDEIGGRAVLDWIERGGPALTAPVTEGFGVSFIKQCVEYELQGSAILHPSLSGVVWQLEFPMKGNIQNA